jgi:solute carrier family 13 (sodium-dependent dicarboxylate transporter), member 2/3/5
MTIGVPIVLVAIPLVALWLSRSLRGTSPLRTDRPGPWQPAERRVVAVFGLTVLAWITQTEPYGGWTRLIGVDPASDATVALAGVVIDVPRPRRRGRPPARLAGRRLDSLGRAAAVRGRHLPCRRLHGERPVDADRRALAGLATLHPFLLILGICLLVTFLTEITSNTAVATLHDAGPGGRGLRDRPAAGTADDPGGDLGLLRVHAAGRDRTERDRLRDREVTIARMAREGLVLNLLLAAIISTAVYLLLGRP